MGDASDIPLFVDLDGTLIKSDAGIESLLVLLRRNFLYLLLLPFWALGGLPRLKRQIARRAQLPVSHLPLNPEFNAWLQLQREKGRRLVLISASDDLLVKQVAASTGLFSEAVGTSGGPNLKAEAKLEKIRSMGGNEFAYAGNAHADLPIWAAASEILAVNCEAGLTMGLDTTGKTLLHFDTPSSRWQSLLRTMRPHQWLKNGLLLLPLILSHQLLEFDMLLRVLVGMASFSLCASSVYLGNDLLDLEFDRQHSRKRQRPLASGDLPLLWAMVATPLLLFSSALIASFLGAQFFLVLMVYWVITCIYSLQLKRVFLIDTLVLALLYTLRIVAGSAAIGVITTDWLLAFAMSLFLGLGLLKRFTELGNIRAEGLTTMPGRAYRVNHMGLLTLLGAAAALLALGVFIGYINAAEIVQLYSRPQVLWAICPLLLFLQWRIWYFAWRGRLDEDPVLFAIEDRQSQLALLASGILIWLAI